MCNDISNTTVCLLCPLGNKPLGHSVYPNGTASASLGKTNRLPVFVFIYQMLTFSKNMKLKEGTEQAEEEQMYGEEKRKSLTGS